MLQFYGRRSKILFTNPTDCNMSAAWTHVLEFFLRPDAQRRRYCAHTIYNVFEPPSFFFPYLGGELFTMKWCVGWWSTDCCNNSIHRRAKAQSWREKKKPVVWNSHATWIRQDTATTVTCKLERPFLSSLFIMSKELRPKLDIHSNCFTYDYRVYWEKYRRIWGSSPHNEYAKYKTGASDG